MLVDVNIIRVQLGKHSMGGKEGGKVRSINYGKERSQDRALWKTIKGQGPRGT